MNNDVTVEVAVKYWKTGTNIIEKALKEEEEELKRLRGTWAEEVESYSEGIIAAYLHALEIMGMPESWRGGENAI